ncbi:sugar ABC transporter ATP-binding protein [Arthrobacter sp. MMS18-M83]|uniref:sugar ABC transporter ATP-binding protein n=1 Tax=Arthrobacter sp. MMS18-M83 TaxID=2996261 RepID=UPI00227B3257|nr:sugar ABC transporter ATP-binding protein [Arthrobacter sp. MMS18-M83]WAH97563.1 sugar ABC transporter ATP-binding protein [Arthrobacter sp. MMS18-M83]
MTAPTAVMPPAISIARVSKTFGPRTVLHPLELNLVPGEIHALLGQNGSGKSTLIKVLGGYHAPDPGRGEVLIAGKPLDFGSTKSAHELGLRIVHQDLGLVAESTVLDNLAIGAGFPTRFGTIRRAQSRREAIEALAAVGLDISPAKRVAELSAAQRTGVAVARALSRHGGKVTVLILDEPTATLPAREVAHLHEMVKKAASQGVAILYVTHHLDEVFRLADRVSVLRDGHVVFTRDVAEAPREDIIHALVGGTVEPVRRESIDVPSGGGQPVLKVSGLRGDALEGVDFEVRPGEIVGVYGLTGSGRESLLGTIFGAREREGGDVRVDGVLLAARPSSAIKKGVAYLAPDRKRGGGLMEMTACENLTLPAMKKFFRGGHLRIKAELAESSQWMDRLAVRPAGAVKAPLASFSGGNQQKILIGKWMRISPRVMLLDEPTQGVDVGAKAQLHRHIIDASDAGAAVVISSTDAEEIATVCDRVLIIRSGVITEQLTGSDISVAELDRRVLRSNESKVETS